MSRIASNLGTLLIVMLITLGLLTMITFVTADTVRETAYQSYSVTLVVDEVNVIEDRDFGPGEIYLKASIDGGSYVYTSIYENVYDGDTITLDWTILDGSERDSFSVRIEVWESDDGYNENSNDFLGYVEYSRSPPTTMSGWHDAIEPIGGINDLQARVLISETADSITTTATTTTGDTTSPTIYGDDDFWFYSTPIGFAEWILYDDNPDRYVVIQDGITIKSGIWESGDSVRISLSDLTSRTEPYIFEISAYDTSNNVATDEIKVYVHLNEEGSAYVAGTSLGDNFYLLGGGIALLAVVGAIFLFSRYRGSISVSSPLPISLAREERQVPTQPMVVCPFCGSKNPFGTTICTVCGSGIS